MAMTVDDYVEGNLTRACVYRHWSNTEPKPVWPARPWMKMALQQIRLARAARSLGRIPSARECAIILRADLQPFDLCPTKFPTNRNQ